MKHTLFIYKSAFALLLAFLPYSRIVASDGNTFTATISGLGCLFTITSEDEKTVSLTSLNDKNSEVVMVIPSIISNGTDNYTITRIDAGALRFAKITSITVPESVTGVQKQAIANCPSLQEVYWNAYQVSSVTGDGAPFSGCASLTTIVFGDNVSKVPDNLFSRCTGTMEDITWNNVKTIGTNAFGGSGITGINLPEGIETLWDKAFQYCTGLTEVTLPKSIKSVGKYQFAGCTGITKVTCLTSADMPGDGSPFLSCPNIEDVEFGDDVTRVPAQLFHSCPSKLSNINWNHVTTIGVSSFRESGIQTFSLPDQITTLERFAIASCKQLEETVIPESIVTIGQQAFAECSKLHVVTFPDKTFTMNGQAFQKTGTDESVTTYEITIPDRAITIPAYCFQNSGITKLTLPASVPQIRDQAFAGCTNLAEVYAYGETIAPPANNNAFAGATYDSETGEKLTPNTYDVADLYVECIRLNGGYRYFKDIHARPRAAKEFTTFARNYQVEADDTHYQCYVATAYDAESHEVTVKKYAQLPMNAGAILWKATPADPDDYLLTGRTAEGDADNIVSLADGDTNYLIGVLTDTTIQPQETIGGTEYTNFLLSNGAYYRFDNAGTLAAGKSYLHLPVSDYWGSVTENEARPLTLRFVDEAEAVVETRIADAETCRQLGLSDGRYYTLQGIRVAQPTHGGIYIHDGKTVVIK